MKRDLVLVYILLLTIVPIRAQLFRYIGVEDGLSNRRVYSIVQDSKGYLWFLTQEGTDRFNGKQFKHFKSTATFGEINSQLKFKWLFADYNTVWQIERQGNIYHYNSLKDQFNLTLNLSEYTHTGSHAIDFSFIDSQHNIWLCSKEQIYLYSIKKREIKALTNPLHTYISCIVQSDGNHFFISTQNAIHATTLLKDSLHIDYSIELAKKSAYTSTLFYLPDNRHLYIGTQREGLFIFDSRKRTVKQLEKNLKFIGINKICKYTDKYILIATNGSGIYKLDTETEQLSMFLSADFNKSNGMNGNNIFDLYIDNEQRIWMSNYPDGITVYTHKCKPYSWIKHETGYKHCLIDDQINYIIEDHEGDLWFATDNGISLYKTKTKEWLSILSSFDKNFKIPSNTFLSLEEIQPGFIWAGSFNTGIYIINKNEMSWKAFNPTSYEKGLRPDKYIRSILKDSLGYVWAGGYYHLKKIDIKKHKLELYRGIQYITNIIEKDKEHLWVGTANGLYLLDKQTKLIDKVKIPIESTYILSLYQDSKRQRLYIGTNNFGLLEYNIQKQSFKQYNTKNSRLISNNIYSILPKGKDDLLLSTESGLVLFDTSTMLFHNWTQSQGLMSCSFNAQSAAKRSNGHYIFGSSKGAIDFDESFKFPEHYTSKMVLSDFRLSYNMVYPNEKKSPLTKSIDKTEKIHLKFRQNTFSIKMYSINYDYPDDVLYTWKLEGFYNKWSEPSQSNTISFTNLNPGSYNLRIRAISNEDNTHILEERTITISIAPPFWRSGWSIIIYVAFFSLFIFMCQRMYWLRKHKIVSLDKIHFFTNTAHDVRTPLTLIKAPLEEIYENEELSHEGKENMKITLKNVDVLVSLTNTLLNFERAHQESNILFLDTIETEQYIQEVCSQFKSYADSRNIKLLYSTSKELRSVRFDKNKMNSIIKNLLTNAIKYTPSGGRVLVTTKDCGKRWEVVVDDNGIGIPKEELKKIFKSRYRGSNATNSNVSGSGLGLMLVWKYVHLHKGRIHVESEIDKGTIINISFPKVLQGLDAKVTPPISEEGKESLTIINNYVCDLSDSKSKENTTKKILIVEDNENLKDYLQHALEKEYKVHALDSAEAALECLKSYEPDIIISDIMMPGMHGDEMCSIIKQNIETSHIPIILLTALAEKAHIVKGLQTGADEYITKPFNIGILKAHIESILQNRLLLKQKYASLNYTEKEMEQNSSLSDLDKKFLDTLQNLVQQYLDNVTFNIDSLCALMGMSRSSFYNKVKALTDISPADYVRIIRLQKAESLLKEGELSITEIAEKTGFCDVKYFREVFKKYFHESPSEYRKRERHEP